MQSYKDLKVWQKSLEVAVSVYRRTAGFPPEERFGLTQQLRQAAASIGANIAEGRGRGSDGEFARFLHYSYASANETETYILLSRELGFLEKADASTLQRHVAEVRRMIYAFLVQLKAADSGRLSR